MSGHVPPPVSERTLTKYVVAHARRTGGDVARTRRTISFLALAGALERAGREADGRPAFVVKGGVALEARLRDRARATKDLDLILNRDDGDLVERLEEAMAQPYEGFAFQRKGPALRMRNGAVRLRVQVAFAGRQWGTVDVDVAHREGETEVDRVSVPALRPDFGIEGPDALECISLRHHVAHKLHALTRPMPEGTENERFRDLVDLLLLRALVRDHAAVCEACAEVFARRGTHGWPPPIAPPAAWREPFARMAAETDLPIRDLDAATAEIEGFVAALVASVPTASAPVAAS